MPIPPFNHVMGVDLNEDEAEDFLKTVIKHFSSKKLPFVCFRVSPLTRPTSFISLLELHGFQRSSEQSIMVFKGKPPEDKLNPDVEIKEIPENELGTFSSLVSTIFEDPTEWKKANHKVLLELMRKGARYYLAYAGGKPIGTATLISLAKTGGIFAVGTLKEYRKRGIGTTLTIKALLDSVDAGNNLHALAAEKGGDAERLYQRIGFETDHTVAFFIKKF
jgi:GNAT superfamily N-acetyltransferase